MSRVKISCACGSQIDVEKGPNALTWPDALKEFLDDHRDCRAKPALEPVAEVTVWGFNAKRNWRTLPAGKDLPPGTYALYLQATAG